MSGWQVSRRRVPGVYRYTVAAWVDHFESWRAELERREDRADIRMALHVGSALIDEAAARAEGSDRSILTEWSAQLRKIADDTHADPTAHKAHGARQRSRSDCRALCRPQSRRDAVARARRGPQACGFQHLV